MSKLLCFVSTFVLLLVVGTISANTCDHPQKYVCNNQYILPEELPAVSLEALFTNDMRELFADSIMQYEAAVPISLRSEVKHSKVLLAAIFLILFTLPGLYIFLRLLKKDKRYNLSHMSKPGFK